MRAVIQRVSRAKVEVNGQTEGAIQQGLLVFLGVEDADSTKDIEWLVRKIIHMRIFSDEAGKMNLSVKDISGQLLVISQFTLHASTKKGNRPSFIKAAPPKKAEALYEQVIASCSEALGKSIESGVFGAHMDVQLINDGPVTIIIDTKQKE